MDMIVKKKLSLKERYNLAIAQEQQFVSLHSHNEADFLAGLSPDFFDRNGST